MIISDAPHKVPLEKQELEYLVKMKEEDTAGLVKTMKYLVLFIVIICIIAAIGMYVIIRLSPDTFVNRGEALPNILVSVLKLALLLLFAVAAGSYYSYNKTLRKVIKDMRGGEKTIEPCTVIRKFQSPQNDTWHVYITSVVRLSVEVTADEYAMLEEGSKINLEYSPYSKVFFGYSISENAS